MKKLSFLALKEIKEEVKAFFLDWSKPNDYEYVTRNFDEEWKKGLKGHVKVAVETAVEYCFFYPGEEDCFNPFLDKKYMDVGWYETHGVLIDIDDINEVVLNYLKEDYEEWKRIQNCPHRFPLLAQHRDATRLFNAFSDKYLEDFEEIIKNYKEGKNEEENEDAPAIVQWYEGLMPFNQLLEIY